MRTPSSRHLALTSLAFGVLLPGCPFTDDYFVAHATGGAAQLGTSGTAGLDSTGGVPMVTPDGGNANAPSEDPSAGGQAGDSDPDGPRGGTAGSGNTSTLGAAGDATGTGGVTSGTGAAGGDGATAGAGTGGGGGSSWGGRAGKGDAGRGGSWTGGAGSGGRGGTGGASGTANQPACDDGIGKGDSCSGSSVQVCYKTCGPDSVGLKSETCQRGEYVEGDCAFPEGHDYSCYGIPASKPAACPGGIPRATQSCTVAECTPCFGGTLSNPTYEDSGGAQKEGYCVCSDEGKWTCASVTAWPCPDGDGCS